ncbi:MAG TPA: carbohydrate kinase family protein [Anaerolineales bacterium]|nr:carbohydrate kinase family protein [Anaerolineales bacterium]
MFPSLQNNLPPIHLLFGRLSRMFLLPPTGRPQLDTPGGNLLYAAAGLALWDSRIGIVARVGEDYPRAWLEQFQARALDTQGVRILPKALDLREFLAFTDIRTRHTDNPVAHFARRELPFPKVLFGYRDAASQLNRPTQLTETSLRQSDIPADYMLATGAHFCPLDFVSHSLLPAVLRQSGFTTLTLDPGRGYMDPIFFDQVPSIVTGLTAFMPSEEKVRALFRGRSEDLWEMAEALAAYGCEMIVIKRAVQGQFLYDAETKTRWEIPAYPSREADPTGAGDAFCGGFLAGYRRTHNALDAALFGNVSASLAIEGSGPFYALDALPGLAEARLEVLRQSVRKI